jgi:hypothetical protein
LIVLALASRAAAQSGGHSLEPPTSNFLALSNISGDVRVLDAQGLVLEKNLSFLPRIALADLSQAQLQDLLETKTAYASLTEFGLVNGTNAQGTALESQLQQTWRQGPSLAGKIQTRLEILEDLRDYNTEIALLPGSLAAANQYALNVVPINNRLTNRAATVVATAAQVEMAEQYQAGGDADAKLAAAQARANYRESAARVEVANDRAMIANGQVAGANQTVTDQLAKCAALAARLAAHGINVPATAPFSPVPPLNLRAEVDAARTGK